MTGDNIHPALTPLATPIDGLRPHPDNYNHGEPPAIAESLTTNGMYKPVIYQKSTGYVLAGNHTLLAARQLGWRSIAAIGLDVEDHAAKRIMIADNQTGRLSTFDDTALALLLEELDDTTGLGFNDTQVETLLAGLDDDVIELEPQPTNATYAETPEEEAHRRDQYANRPSTVIAQQRATGETPSPDIARAAITSIALTMTVDERDDILRDLDAVAKLTGPGTTRAQAAARAARIALVVLDAATSNRAPYVMDWREIIAMSEMSMEDASA